MERERRNRSREGGKGEVVRLTSPRLWADIGVPALTSVEFNMKFKSTII
jgi:hypothetical protein